MRMPQMTATFSLVHGDSITRKHGSHASSLPTQQVLPSRYAGNVLFADGLRGKRPGK
jgi:prepilin-type processing-associated H-X9-DG protein